MLKPLYIFSSKKGKRQTIHPETITDADMADDITHLTNTPTQAESLLLSLEHAADDIGLHVNTDKTEYLCCNKKGDISTLNGGSLKLMDKFTNLGSSISSTENGMNMRLAKAWTGNDRLSIIWNSDLTDKTERNFFPSSDRINSTIWMHLMDGD